MSFTTKTESDIINDLLVNVVTNTDAITDVNVGSVLRIVIEALAKEIGDMYTEVQSIYDGTRMLTATSTDLENLGAIVGLTRNTGTKSSGDVSFIRNSTASSDFTISAGSIVSTNPALGTQYKFIVKSDTTFDSDITENILFKDGVENYKLTERLVGDLVSLTGTASSSAHTFVKNTDFSVTNVSGLYLPDVSSLVTIDTCESTTGWTKSTDATALALDTTNKTQGTNALKLGKSGTSSTSAYY